MKCGQIWTALLQTTMVCVLHNFSHVIITWFFFGQCQFVISWFDGIFLFIESGRLWKSTAMNMLWIEIPVSKFYDWFFVCFLPSFPVIYIPWCLDQLIQAYLDKFRSYNCSKTLFLIKNRKTKANSATWITTNPLLVLYTLIHKCINTRMHTHTRTHINTHRYRQTDK